VVKFNARKTCCGCLKAANWSDLATNEFGKAFTPKTHILSDVSHRSWVLRVMPSTMPQEFALKNHRLTNYYGKSGVPQVAEGPELGECLVLVLIVWRSREASRRPIFSIRNAT
jgi:hypothetical protein